MFKLIRRISQSFMPRPDRPWEDDATSNAPNPRRKRRLSSTERDAGEEIDEENARKKKQRGDSETLGTEDVTGTPPAATNEDTGPIVSHENGDGEKGEVTVLREGSLEVKVVTEGVKEVELDDKQPTSESPTDSGDQEEGRPTATEDSAKESTDTAVVATEEAVNGDTVKPEAIPLPEENSDESDELRSSSPPAQEESTNDVAVEPAESQEVNEEETPPIPDGPRLPRSSPRKLRTSSPKKIARV